MDCDFVPWSITQYLLNVCILLGLILVIGFFLCLIFEGIKEILFNKDDKK